MQALVAQTAQNLADRGIILPVFPSHNTGMTPEALHATEAAAETWYAEHARRTAGLFK
jgi:hypothetical protein